MTSCAGRADQPINLWAEGYARRMRSGRSLTTKVTLAIVLLVAGLLVGAMIFAHVAGRTTSIPPRADAGS